MSTAQSPAIDRGIQMAATISMANLPHEAFIYAGYLCMKHGMCSEVMITAYCHYAQIVEGLTCDDAMYLATDRVRADYADAQANWERVEEGGKIRVLPKRTTA